VRSAQANHEQFCRRDEWEEAGGTGHDKWQERLPDGQLLRTTIQRHKTDYGQDLKAAVLLQLDVDEATFWEVIRSGEPADRPAPAPDEGRDPMPDWIVQALQLGRFNEVEIAALGVEEPEHVALAYFSLPRELGGAEVRRRLLDALALYRSDQ